MALLDGLYHKAVSWLWINTNLIPNCENCAKGLRADPIKGRLLTRFTHPVNGQDVLCTGPWHWRGKVATGKMKGG